MTIVILQSSLASKTSTFSCYCCNGALLTCDAQTIISSYISMTCLLHWKPFFMFAITLSNILFFNIQFNSSSSGVASIISSGSSIFSATVVNEKSFELTTPLSLVFCSFASLFACLFVASWAFVPSFPHSGETS